MPPKDKTDAGALQHAPHNNQEPSSARQDEEFSRKVGDFSLKMASNEWHQQADDDEQSSSLTRRLVTEIREQLGTILPTIMALFLSRCPSLISLRFVGVIGTDELAAAALAMTLMNVTGMSFAVGLNSALTTLAGQARGDLQQQLSRSKSTTEKQRQQKQRRQNTDETLDESSSLLSRGDSSSDDEESHDHHDYSSSTLPASNTSNNSHIKEKVPLLPLVYLYRGLLVQLMFVLPIGAWWLIGVKPMLLALGQGELLSTMAQDYLRILAPSLLCYSINWTLTSWFQAIEMAEVPAFGAAAGLVLHIPFTIFFVDTLGMGYLGTAVATAVFQFIQPVCLLPYMLIYPAGRKRTIQQMAAAAVGRDDLSFWPEARLAFSWTGIQQFLGLAIPGLVLISEWWASEVSIFLSGHLMPYPQLALGGMAIYQSVNTFCFMFPISCGVAVATRVGNLLGAGKSREASFAARVSILCAGCVSALCGSILFFTPRSFFPSLFAPDEVELIEETGKLFTLLSLYVLGDGLQCAFTGIIKGCGRQVVTMPIVVISYWVVGLPLAYHLAFVKNDGFMCDDNYFCGDVGLVAGMTTGTWVHMILIGLVVLGTTDWVVEAKKVKARLATHSRSPQIAEV